MCRGQPGSEGLPCRPPNMSSHSSSAPRGPRSEMAACHHAPPCPWLPQGRQECRATERPGRGGLAETPQGTSCAARLACSVLSESLAILVPNKESVGADMEGAVRAALYRGRHMSPPGARGDGAASVQPGRQRRAHAGPEPDGAALSRNRKR